jgi:hypothetical protein
MGVVTSKKTIGKEPAPPADPNFKTLTIALPVGLVEEVERWASLNEVSIDSEIADLIEIGLGRGTPTKKATS